MMRDSQCMPKEYVSTQMLCGVAQRAASVAAAATHPCCVAELRLQRLPGRPGTVSAAGTPLPPQPAHPQLVVQRVGQGGVEALAEGIGAAQPAFLCRCLGGLRRRPQQATASSTRARSRIDGAGRLAANTAGWDS